MQPRFLIFPCLFTDQQFAIINQIRSKLLSSKLELATLCTLNPNVQILRVDYIVNDLTELLSNRIAKGWRYNSYVLNLAIVKLDYAHTILELDLNLKSSEIVVTIVHCQETLLQILFDCYSDYMSEAF